MACAAAKPIVDGLESEFPELLRVLRVDVQSTLGRQLIRQYGNFTPTFILFYPAGNELWRAVGSLGADQVRQALP